MIYEAAGRPRPRTTNYELWSWLFMRISGIVLLVMVLLHFAIMHVFTPIEQVNFAFVAGRYSTLGWRIYDLVMLSLALIHGLNGVRVVTDDLFHSKWQRVTLLSILYLVAFVFLALGALVVFTFQPTAGR
jgi:succinate dehydrogenase / fumarate reductase membrane anchor subunit